MVDQGRVICSVLSFSEDWHVRKCPMEWHVTNNSGPFGHRWNFIRRQILEFWTKNINIG